MRRPRFEGLIQNALALMISSAVSAIIGMVFWAAAAHLTSAAVLGRASAEIAALAILSLLSQLSYGSTFERFIPVAGAQTRTFVIRAYLICTGVSIVLGLGYELLNFGHAFLPTGLWWRAFFVISIVLWTIFGLQDSALVGLRASRWVPVENIAYSIAKLALLPLFIMWSTGEGIFVSWMFPVIWLIIAVNWYLFRRRIPEHHAKNPASERLPSVRQLVALSGAQYASLLVSILTSSVTTLIVIDRLGPVANAHYYIPAQISSGAVLALSAIMRSFLVEASTDPSALRQFARTTLRAILILLLPALIFGLIFAPQILDVFGRSYSNDGTTLLRMMMLSLPAIAVTSFYAAFAWVDRKVWWFAVREIVSAAIFFAVLFALLGHFGILAIGISSLVESGVLGFFFLPILIRRYRLAVNSPPVSSGPSSTD
jgi:O-antigen/teichoic acid export membrane protein